LQDGSVGVIQRFAVVPPPNLVFERTRLRFQCMVLPAIFAFVHDRPSSFSRLSMLAKVRRFVENRADMRMS
jgi:hypothetical protein